jgi:hypothetical protein
LRIMIARDLETLVAQAPRQKAAILVSARVVFSRLFNGDGVGIGWQRGVLNQGWKQAASKSSSSANKVVRIGIMSVSVCDFNCECKCS